jgi:unsaturated rhamnogalacturonyl hydrolase
MKVKSLVMAACAISFTATLAFAQVEFSADSIVKACKRVGNARMNTRMGNFWQHGAYFAGAIQLFDLTKEQRYLDSVISWGDYYQWRRCSWAAGDPGTDLDNICCEQAYLEVYLRDTAGHAARATESVKDMHYYAYTLPPGGKTRPRFAYSDIMFMGGPVYARAAVAGKDPAIFDSLYVIWSNTAKDLYDPRVKLYWRGASSIDTTKPVFYWSRGNGWVMGSACRILDYLPSNHPRRAYFEQKVKDLCAGLLPWQNKIDGCWRSSIADTAAYPSKETSGTAFFCYGICWAINRGLIDRATYLPAAKLAWKGLLGCIQSNGKVGYSQPPGWQPGPVAAGDNSEYTDGAFLMAGNELNRLLNSSINGPAVSKNGQCVALQKPVTKLLSVGPAARITVPANAKGFSVYTLTGKKIFEQKIAAEPRDRSIAAPREICGRESFVVRYDYK